MLNSLTWKFYVNAILIIVIGYYVIAALLLYFKEIIGWAKSRSSTSVNPVETTASKAPNRSVMGGINPSEASIEQRITLVAENVFGVTSEDEAPEEIQPPEQNSSSPTDDQLLIGTVADLLEEIKTLIQLAAEYKSSKPDIQALFHALFMRYPQLKGTSYQDAISLYIVQAASNQFAFEVSHSEIITWWITPRQTIK